MTDKKYDNVLENIYHHKMKSDIGKCNNLDESAPMVCRDYLRNVCKRERCKYVHPIRNDKQEFYVFCHDHQNNGCFRAGCRFVHCTIEEEAYYHKYGELLPHVYEAYKNGGSIGVDVTTDEDSCSTGVDHVKGRCQRDSCTYRHIMATTKDSKSTQQQQQQQQQSSCQNTNKNGVNKNCKHGDDCYRRFMSERDYWWANDDDDYHNGYGKRRCIRDDDMSSLERKTNCDMIENRTMWMLESENNMLRKRVMELKKKNDELQATNEFLLEQNARMRIGDKTPLSLAAVTVPAVTITNTGSLQHQGPQTQVINALRTAVAASMATVPVSLAAVATTPVSIATVSMAPVQIPPVVTVAQAPGDPSALGPNMNTDSQSLVSYPIINGSTIIQGTMQRH